ncbi:uncharacterized protein DDB_G0290685-like [Ipomoea triloba]|uniref:uncharacterized protein DDB_G0290685-like n=1 Tax=Ipomoea triloba TaxID=35885 RepID=UPI00125E23CA|nr:uncharacterized protein DDB_G0290685-like [Ipomoea triloba]
MRVGAKIGRPINIDTATSLVSRASFARVCVEVDITKPLLAKFTLRNRVRPIVYEGLHLICFKCGTYGHNAEACSLNRKEVTTLSDNMDGSESPENDAGAGNSQGNDRRKTYRETTLFRPEITEDYGSWMVATKPKRNYSRNQGNGNQGGKDNGKIDQHANTKGKNSSAHQGSRFASLAENINEDEEQVTEGNSREQSAKQSQNQGTKRAAQAKGKRPTTQISEKQIMGNNMHGMHRTQHEAGETSTRRNSHKKTQGTQSNQAGAATEHTLVTGDKSGAKSTQVSETEHEDHADGMDGLELLTEHHGDPPCNELPDRPEMTSIPVDQGIPEETGVDAMEMEL